MCTNPLPPTSVPLFISLSISSVVKVQVDKRHKIASCIFFTNREMKRRVFFFFFSFSTDLVHCLC